MNVQLTAFLARAEQLMERIEAALPHGLEQPDWSASIAFRYRRRSSGRGLIAPVAHIGAISLADLKEIDAQKEKIQRNTEQFVKGLPANNVLLTGSRGTGKSSLIRACLHAYADQGLRLIEVDKAELVDLPDIVELVAQRPEKFIVFCDDLSFDEGEPGYKALKSVLDGSVAAATPNVLIYATSNRRHLLPEYMADNLTYTHTADGEVHPGEVVEEKISLSERFGLWVSFYPFNQDEYLLIVAQWLAALGVKASRIAQARPEALVWALERGSRSGRVAWQFARDFAGRHANTP
ncbi:MAG: ATP-binding protein [Pseudomonadota bacterium]